jgi:hypothetical protein
VTLTGILVLPHVAARIDWRACAGAIVAVLGPGLTHARLRPRLTSRFRSASQTRLNPPVHGWPPIGFELRISVPDVAGELFRRLGVATAIGLPFILLVANCLILGRSPEPTISDYYYTALAPVFELVMIGVAGHFLHRPEPGALHLGRVAGLAALGIAVFPTARAGAVIGSVGVVHVMCAIVFASALVALTAESGWNSRPTTLLEMAVHRAACVTIACCVTLLTADLVFSLTPERSCFPFWLETVAVLAFGASWLLARPQATFRSVAITRPTRPAPPATTDATNPAMWGCGGSDA